MSKQVGLRERKKQQTRDLIAQTARRLFGERGFDAVTVADVALAADVSRKTVFNHFPTKEDLFYSGLELFEERLLDAVRGRPPGESILAAFVRFITNSPGLLTSDDPDADARLRELAKLAESPALLAREQQIYARYTDALAALVAEETQADPSEIAPWVAANAMLGLHRALVTSVRQQWLAGQRDRAHLVRELRAQAGQAAALLERGLGQLGG